MHQHVKVFAIALLALSAAACTTTFKAAATDPNTGRYNVASGSAIPANEITIRRPFPVDTATRMIFVRSNLNSVESYDSYFEQSLQNIGFFGQVLRKDDFERMLVRDGHSDEVQTVDGFAGLARAAQVYGPFLVVDFEVEGGAGYQVRIKMQVYNASNAEELLHVEHQVTNWAGLDSTLFQPTFNVLSDWLDENSATFPHPPQTPDAPPAAAPAEAYVPTPAPAAPAPAQQ